MNFQRQTQLYRKNSNQATLRHCRRQKGECPLTEFERRLNREIAMYAKQNQLAQYDFFCVECGNHNSRPIPKDMECPQCSCCGKYNRWLNNGTGMEFGGES